MAEKLKVKFLTVIWGVRYIGEFARVSLPSYLAAGNLPYVAVETDLEILGHGLEDHLAVGAEDDAQHVTGRER